MRIFWKQLHASNVFAAYLRVTLKQLGIFAAGTSRENGDRTINLWVLNIYIYIIYIYIYIYICMSYSILKRVMYMYEDVYIYI